MEGVENHAVLAFSKHFQSYTLQHATLPVEKKRCANLIGERGWGRRPKILCGGWGSEPSCSCVLGAQVLGTVPKGRWFTNGISSRCVAEEKREVCSHNYLLN